VGGGLTCSSNGHEPFANRPACSQKSHTVSIAGRVVRVHVCEIKKKIPYNLFVLLSICVFSSLGSQ